MYLTYYKISFVIIYLLPVHVHSLCSRWLKINCNAKSKKDDLFRVCNAKVTKAKHAFMYKSCQCPWTPLICYFFFMQCKTYLKRTETVLKVGTIILNGQHTKAWMDPIILNWNLMVSFQHRPRIHALWYSRVWPIRVFQTSTQDCEKNKGNEYSKIV